jgi:predicted Fe-S protein YdhL (DUF1289 family)
MVTVCIGVCKMNMEQTHCIGCKRNLMEIEQWRDYNDEKRNEIKMKLERRKINAW